MIPLFADISDESSESESEDDISSHHDVMSSAYRTSPVGFNLGIDVSETSRGMIFRCFISEKATNALGHFMLLT